MTAVSHPERALHQGEERRAEKPGHDREVGDQPGPLSPALWPSSGVRSQDDGLAAAAPLQSVLHDEHGSHRGQLQQGQHRRHREIQQVGGLPVDLHLDRRPGRAPEDAHDAEGGEREQEGDGGGGGDGRPQGGQGDRTEGLPT